MNVDSVRKVDSFRGNVVTPPSPTIGDVVSAATSPTIQGKLSHVFRESTFEGLLKQVSSSVESAVGVNSVETGSVYSEIDDFHPECDITANKRAESVELETQGLNEKTSLCKNTCLFENPENSPTICPSGGNVGLSFLPGQCERLPRYKGESFNLMVAGRTGTGKSTFINTLFGSKLISKQDNDSCCTIAVQKYELLERNFQLNLTTITTPSFGSGIDNQFSWLPICNFIDEQFRLYLFQQEQPVRDRLVDNRVHCCLYFIEPCCTRLNRLDVLSMHAISQRVNLIPVISKCDTLSEDELQKFKHLINSELQLHDVAICDLILDHFVKDKITKSVPFAVIGSDEIHSGKRGRLYQWGLAEVENPKHCDFSLLSDILLRENMLDLISSTEACYERYRLRCLEKRFEQGNTEGVPEDKINGFEQLKIYHSVTLSEFEKEEKLNETIFELKQQQIKDKLGEYISIQETRFKEWKQALVEKQNELNKDIELQHSKMVELQNEIDLLMNSPNDSSKSIEAE